MRELAILGNFASPVHSSIARKIFRKMMMHLSGFAIRSVCRIDLKDWVVALVEQQHDISRRFLFLKFKTFPVPFRIQRYTVIACMYQAGCSEMEAMALVYYHPPRFSTKVARAGVDIRRGVR